MKKVLFLLVLCGRMVSAQEAVPVTKQDLQDLRKEVLQAKRAAERAAKGQDAARSAEKQELNGIKSAVSENSEAQKKDAATVAAEIKKQRELIATEAAKSRRTTVWFVGLSSVGLLLIGGTAFALWVRKGRNAKTRAEASSAIGITTKPSGSTRLRNPDMQALQKLREETGRMKFPIIIELEAKSGFAAKPPVECEAIFPEGQFRPVVFFPNETDPVSWEKRKPHAAILAEKMSQTS